MKVSKVYKMFERIVLKEGVTVEHIRKEIEKIDVIKFLGVWEKYSRR